MGPAPPLEVADWSQHYDDNDNSNNSLNNRLGQKANYINGKSQTSESGSSIWRNEASSDDLYRDFNNIYETLKRSELERWPLPVHGESQQTLNANVNNPNRASWSQRALLETEALDKSLLDVEEALKKVVGPHLTSMQHNADDFRDTNRLVVSQPQVPPGSPMNLSVATSEQTRTDSRNTNQSYQNGPALVEEMTLSDLEDEISYSLMATKASSSNWNKYNYTQPDDRDFLLKGRRSRAPLPGSLSASHYYPPPGSNSVRYPQGR